MASPGNANNLYIIVSVEDVNGAPVPGLAIGNFAIGSEIVGPGGSTSHISTVTNGKLPAFTCYRFFRSPDKTGKPGFTSSRWR